MHRTLTTAWRRLARRAAPIAPVPSPAPPPAALDPGCVEQALDLLGVIAHVRGLAQHAPRAGFLLVHQRTLYAGFSDGIADATSTLCSTVPVEAADHRALLHLATQGQGPAALPATGELHTRVFLPASPSRHNAPARRHPAGPAPRPGPAARHHCPHR